MKFLLSVIAGMLVLAFFLFWKVKPSDWIQVETNSPQVQKCVRMAGTTLQKSSASSRMMKGKKQPLYPTAFWDQNKQAPVQVLVSINEESQAPHTKTPR